METRPFYLENAECCPGQAPTTRKVQKSSPRRSAQACWQEQEETDTRSDGSSQQQRQLDSPTRKVRLRSDAPDAPSRRVRIQYPDPEGEVRRVLKSHVAWTPRRFVVRPEMFEDIIFRLQAPRPQVDAFADRFSAKCKTYWGKGGAVSSAWSQHWSAEKVGLIWANPTFNLYDFYDIVRKAGKDQADMILVAPDWPQASFYAMLWTRAVAYHYYDPGSKLFDKKRCNREQFEWGVWAVRLQGPVGVENPKICKIKEAVYQKNNSAKRRYRRRMLQRSSTAERED